jgi:hypothetical protein
LLDIGFTSSGDLNESQLLSFVGVGNGFVNTWYDQSENGYHFSEAIQPYLIVQSGVTQKINGRISIFDTSNLIRLGFSDLPFSVNINSNDGFHVIDVSNLLSTPGNTAARRHFSYGVTNDFNISGGGVLLCSDRLFRLKGDSDIVYSYPRDLLRLKESIGEGTEVYLKDNNSTKIGTIIRTYNLNGTGFNILNEYNPTSTIQPRMIGYNFEKIFFNDFNEPRREFLVNNINNYYSIY